MVDVKQAVAAASSAAHEFFTDDGLAGLELEEVEFQEEDNIWLITLGLFLPCRNPPTGIAATMAMSMTRKHEEKYKIFRVDAESGKVLSMKI
jgi:hypothetical protein